MPKLDETISGEYRDQAEPLKLPGCVPIHGRDLAEPVQDRTSDWYKMFLRSTKRMRLAEGIMFNTFMELEENAIKALLDEEAKSLPLYPIGPIIQTGSSIQVKRVRLLKMVGQSATWLCPICLFWDWWDPLI